MTTTTPIGEDAANGAIEKAIDKLIYTAWYSGEQDGSEGVAWSERGDSYNGMLRDRIQDDKRALLAALTANGAMGEASNMALTSNQFAAIRAGAAALEKIGGFDVFGPVLQAMLDNSRAALTASGTIGGLTPEQIDAIAEPFTYADGTLSVGRVHSLARAVAAALTAEKVARQEPFPYQKTFDAIAAATSVSARHIAISVTRFREAFAAPQQPTQSAEQDEPCTNCGLNVDPKCACERGRKRAASTQSARQDNRKKRND